MATKELPDSASAETTVYYITNMLPTERAHWNQSGQDRSSPSSLRDTLGSITMAISWSQSKPGRSNRASFWPWWLERGWKSSKEELADTGFLLHSKPLKPQSQWAHLPSHIKMLFAFMSLGVPGKGRGTVITSEAEPIPVLQITQRHI